MYLTKKTRFHSLFRDILRTLRTQFVESFPKARWKTTFWNSTSLLPSILWNNFCTVLEFAFIFPPQSRFTFQACSKIQVKQTTPSKTVFKLKRISGPSQFKQLPLDQTGIISIRYLVPNQYCIFPAGLFCNIQADLISMCNSADFDVSNQFARISVPSLHCELLIVLSPDNFSIDLLVTCDTAHNSASNKGAWKLSGGHQLLQLARKLIERLISNECPGLMREDNKENVLFLCPMCIKESKYFPKGTREDLALFLNDDFSNLAQAHPIQCKNKHLVDIDQIILGTPVWVW